MRIIKRIQNNYKVLFDRGTFDDFCVYVSDEYNKKSAPKDTEYFEFFRNLSEEHGIDKVYNDFISIYEMTDTTISFDVRNKIDEIVKSYPNNIQFEIEKNLTVIWGGMIAEENKDNTYLGKRVKHLGMYQVLKENMDVEEAANFSKNKPWRELDSLMKEKGI
jgi:hypothetical protein